ncbi:uncharacterized protein LAESUDRAFT_512572 [Laetiporus sulphureus 93-53]|uniref:Uncharacterized protein n=1 Tax=Laetiporus sulphureus 93-53 TaxID=1314785 RepID=A0A165FZ24_9APHY|nr:uncharacterized protein LAESUDRAFT_512572 [Laetiporus sulphureus 93-53]KZT09601.1 hypothetical protein LAESUDRAFT_512572 [Laetiporus sulphureus 93-53]
MSDAKTSQAASDFFRPKSAYQHPVLGPNNAQAQLRMRLSSCISPSPCPISHRLVFLDAVPSLRLETYIRELRTALTRGTCLTLKFTTIGTSISFFSRSFVLAMLPFLSRRSMHGQVTPDVQCHGLPSQFPSRPAFPLLSSLSQVLQLLVSSPTPFSICSVENTSEDYAMLLNDYAHDLGDNPIVRQQFVQRWGMEGWREERLYALWEAAAFNAQFLERWSVTVQK